MAGALEGKVGVITGGASGIGQACAVRFAEEGADIVVADFADGSDTVAKVEALGRKAIYVKVDTTDGDQVDAMVQAGVDAFGHVDVCVAAAGIAAAPSPDRQISSEQDAGHIANLKTEEFTRVIDVNLTGVFQTNRAMIRQILKQGTQGSIINIASSAARIPLAGASPYCCSKAAVWMLSKVAGVELAQKGIRVNAVGPGYTTTPMWNVPEDSAAHEFAMSITPMGRNGTVEEQAAACLWLASDEASFVTGQILHPAGGQFTG
jgi:3-oxoacyl-[acyl-carrier protein] reductase